MAASSPASATKKKGRHKGTTLPLSDFLSSEKADGGSTSGGSSSYVVSQRSANSWADETEGLDSVSGSTSWPEAESYSRPIDRSKLPTAPRSSRPVEVDYTKLPNDPPYTAFLGNLPFDVEKEDIVRFFKEFNVSEVRLPREGGADSGRMKGFGYAEFQTVDDLVNALTLNNEKLKNRSIRVDIAGQNQEGREGRDHHYRPVEDDRTSGDWRKGGPSLPPPESYSRGGRDTGTGSGFERGGGRQGSDSSYDRDSSSGGYRRGGGYGNRDGVYGNRDGGGYGSRDGGYGNRDGGGFGSRDGGGFGSRDGGGYGRDGGGYGSRDGGGFGSRDSGGYSRDGGGYGSRDGGGYGSRDSGGYSSRDGGGYSRDGGGYGRDGGGGYGRDGGGGYGNRRGYGDSREGGYDRQGGGYEGGRRGYGGDRYQDQRGGDPERGGGPEPREERERGGEEGREGHENAPPRERKKLQLQPRSQPRGQPLSPSSEGAKASSIFGSAKPVDTALREKQIEERLLREKADVEEQIQKDDVEKKDKPTGWKTRHDSERSYEGRRSRHSSTSSGRGGPTPVIRKRTESERSTEGSGHEGGKENREGGRGGDPHPHPHPDQPAAPGEGAKVVILAPPPRENPWAKRGQPPLARPLSQEDGEGAPSQAQPHSQQVEAPPPKENPWRKKAGQQQQQRAPPQPSPTSPRETQPPNSGWRQQQQPRKRQDSSGDKQPPPQPDSARPPGPASSRQQWSTAQSRGGRSAGAGGQQENGGGARRGGRQQEHAPPGRKKGGGGGPPAPHDKKDRPPKAAEPKKYEEAPPPDFSHQSKFALLLTEGEGDENSD